jgi:hypothetical protein
VRPGPLRRRGLRGAGEQRQGIQERLQHSGGGDGDGRMGRRRATRREGIGHVVVPGHRLWLMPLGIAGGAGGPGGCAAAAARGLVLLGAIGGRRTGQDRVGRVKRARSGAHVDD